MERTKPIKMHDARNCSPASDFTQIPNTILRHPGLSAGAKTVLSILLSNRTGWKSCVTTIVGMMKEGETAVKKALTELEETGYLMRIRYRDKKTKTIAGMFWAYSDTPGCFNISCHINDMGAHGYEPTSDYLIKEGKKVPQTQYSPPADGNPPDGMPPDGNPALRILSNNTKGKNTKVEEEERAGGDTPITKSMFAKFWQIYPRKTDKGKALTKWNAICGKPAHERPTWIQVKKAVYAQKKSQRWADSKYIPYAATWLGQSRWLDDPNEMTIFAPAPAKGVSQGTGIVNKIDYSKNVKTIKL